MLPNMQNISAIIFDLGGVILNIDYNKPAEQFKKLGLENFSELYSKAQQNGLFDNLETGKINKRQFCESLRNISGKWLSDKQIIDAWNSLLLDLPAERMELLFKLKKKFKLYLLSNTNEIHVDYFENYIEKQYGSFIFKEIFTKYYYSHQLGYRKPDKVCFEYVLHKNNLNPQETLFIDDSLQHIEGAKSCGIITRHLANGEDIITVFDTLL
jgi:putative hydrolase of the HAD superfamily